MSWLHCIVTNRTKVDVFYFIFMFNGREGLCLECDVDTVRVNGCQTRDTSGLPTLRCTNCSSLGCAMQKTKVKHTIRTVMYVWISSPR